LPQFSIREVIGMRLRSPLFAPGDSERKMAKAIASDADAVILDLEDSVAAPTKPVARAMVPAVVRAHSDRDLIVRVNPRGTSWYLDDLAAVVPARPTAVMLPKCSGPEDLGTLNHHLEALEAASGAPAGSIGVVAIVTETAASVFGLGHYKDVASRLVAICFGAEDLSADLGISPRHPDGSYPAAVIAARAQVLIAAGALGVPAIDTPYPDHSDPAGLRREAEVAAADGFAGKILIHPAQIDIVNAAFMPSPERVCWAERVNAAFAANPDAGVFALDGKMIDRPHYKLARRILAAAGRESATE
jgi:citrate lyase subunit beta/citryl-CoA lyase